jgi:hypothetical protein
MEAKQAFETWNSYSTIMHHITLGTSLSYVVTDDVSRRLPKNNIEGV